MKIGFIGYKYIEDKKYILSRAAVTIVITIYFFHSSLTNNIKKEKIPGKKNIMQELKWKI